MDSPNGLWSDPWSAMWQCAAIWGRASADVMARMWGPKLPRNDSLATLGLAMEHQLGTAACLRLVQVGLRAASARSWFDLTHSFLGVPGLLLSRRVSS